MVQFNLLPDIKLQYIKARRTKYLFTFFSLVIGGAVLAVFVFVFLFVNVAQRKSINDLNKDISKYSATLKSTPDLDKMLTVQNQLGTLTSLHESKPVASRLFTYLAQITPANANLNQLNVDFGAHTMTVGGSALSLDTIKLFADVLKGTTYTTQDTPQGEKGKNAFDSVVLASFSKSDSGVNFTITMNYDAAIFDVNQNVTLHVPSGAEGNQASTFGSGSN